MLEDAQHYMRNFKNTSFLERQFFPAGFFLLSHRAAIAAVTARYADHSSLTPLPTPLLFAIFFTQGEVFLYIILHILKEI